MSFLNSATKTCCIDLPNLVNHCPGLVGFKCCHTNVGRDFGKFDARGSCNIQFLSFQQIPPIASPPVLLLLISANPQYLVKLDIGRLAPSYEPGIIQVSTGYLTRVFDNLIPRGLVLGKLITNLISIGLVFFDTLHGNLVDTRHSPQYPPNIGSHHS